ncbi:hypothetical protein POUND7_014611 [Theobroma cacao]
MLLQIFSLQSGFLISQLPVRYLGVPLVPRRFIKKVTQLCHSFFWKVNDSPVKVLVSVGISSVIPNLKVLGLKNLKEWSKPCILKNTWLILIKSGSLWVAWTSAYILEGRSELWLGQLSVRGILNFISKLEIDIKNAVIYFTWRERNCRHFLGQKANTVSGNPGSSLQKLSEGKLSSFTGIAKG